MTPTDRTNFGRLFWVISQFQAATYTDVTTTIGPDLRKVTCVIHAPDAGLKTTKKFHNPVEAAEFFQEAL